MARSRFAALVPVNDPVRKYGPANKYDPGHCSHVRHMVQEEKFVEEWVSELGVTLSTIYHWANTYPEFEQALHEAHWLCRAFWAKKARERVQGAGMSPTLLITILERRFADMWDRNASNMHEHFENRNRSHDVKLGKGPSTATIRAMGDDELRERIEQLAARRRLEQRRGRRPGKSD